MKKRYVFEKKGLINWKLSMYSWENYHAIRDSINWRIVETFYFVKPEIGGVFIQKLAPEKHILSTNK